MNEESKLAKIRLAIIADQLDTDGGTENYIARLLNHLSSQGYQLYLFVSKKEYVKLTVPETITVLEYEHESRLRTILSLIKKIRQTPIDICYIPSSYLLSRYGLLIKLLTQAKLIGGIQNLGHNFPISITGKWLYRYSHKVCDHIISNSAAAILVSSPPIVCKISILSLINCFEATSNGDSFFVIYLFLRQSLIFDSLTLLLPRNVPPKEYISSKLLIISSDIFIFFPVNKPLYPYK